MKIHLNHAGSGPMAQAATSIMLDFIRREGEVGAYEAEAEASDILEDRIYRQIGDMLHVPHDRVALFGSATAAWAAGIARLRFSADDVVWITPFEYAGNLLVLREMARKQGFAIQLVPLADGSLDLEWMRNNLRKNVRLVSITHIPSTVGYVSPVREVSIVLRGHPALLALDACQSVGQIEIDNRAIRADLITGAGRKFLCGPRGTAFGYYSDRLLKRVDVQAADLHVLEPV